jgi:hypothetical protein
MIEDPHKTLFLYEYERLCDEFLAKLKYSGSEVNIVRPRLS